MWGAIVKILSMEKIEDVDKNKWIRITYSGLEKYFLWPGNDFALEVQVPDLKEIGLSEGDPVDGYISLNFDPPPGIMMPSRIWFLTYDSSGNIDFVTPTQAMKSNWQASNFDWYQLLEMKVPAEVMIGTYAFSLYLVPAGSEIHDVIPKKISVTISEYLPD